jgi:hypothetical protein
MTPETPQPASVVDPDAEMVERVARALYEAEGGTKWNILYEGKKDDYRYSARCAIALCRPVYRREGMEMAKRECDRYAEKDWRLGEGFRNKAARDLSAAIEKLMEKNDG